MQEMTHEEIRQFLQGGPRTAHLATVRVDGRPHVAPVWYDLDLDGDDLVLVFTTWHTTVKAANLRRDPRVAVSVDDDRPPFSFVLIEGSAAVYDARESGDVSELRRWAGRIAGRYMGADQADAFGERNGVPGELLVRVTPDRIVARKAIAD
jgi:PPOX class probable F420-dependent enzyme